MSDKTGIEWTDATWNPVTGCSKVSQGCKHCYAERDWARLSAPRPTQNIYTGRAFTDVQCHPERLSQPLRWEKPRRIFVNSMSDLFHEDVSGSFVSQVFEVMARCPQHQFQILTKRPRRMQSVADSQALLRGRPLPNVWLGVSVEDQATANERIPVLLHTPARVRWISAEPLLGAIDLKRLPMKEECASECCGRWMHDALTGTAWCDADGADPDPVGCSQSLHWVVVGGESGPHARSSHPDWFRSLRDQCFYARVPFLFKQWGEFIEQDHDRETRTLDQRHPEQLSMAARCDAFISERGHVVTNLDAIVADEPYRGMVRAGKKANGRHLDGRTWDGYPA